MSPTTPTVLAVGAWLKNAACLFEDGRAVWSPMHGDLGDPQACVALDRSLDTLLAQATSPVAAIAHDLHPDFYSTQRAVALADRLGVPAIGVQHHHAHIAAVMAEHGLTEPVVGLALDGVGLGTDGVAWGGELLWVAPGEWRRLGHLWPLRLAGGDVAAREPWRMAAAAMQTLGRGADIEARYTAAVGAQAARTVARMLDTGLNSAPTTSTGRWFDAAAGALGVSVRQSHEAEAAIALESAAKRWFAAHGEPTLDSVVEVAGDSMLDLRPLLARLLDWPDGENRCDEAAAWFHVALADGLAQWAIAAAQATQVDTVCLGGGCFMNALLTRRVTLRLQSRGLRVLRPQATSCGDAGLALGQAWAVAQQIHLAPGVLTESLSCV
ncbi:carbamoyltransferase HypF [Methyloversatilis sp. XJ19-13]|uniref:Kae1-like domain-containing protein n=1 Tax=Methyloversatilis sp. XJ19-13 TaxID=2963430 RepID=UPI00211CB8F1|nr:carbamoyltransferase HypF [Methyloversatilis sp. XJ19-13]MCQ9375425.1 carbamoyltransferase HypF [Methyloversatilis sp. XJ19-13]